MNKLLPLAFYALVIPAVTLSSTAVLAQQPSDRDTDRAQQSSDRDARRAEQQRTQRDRNASLVTDQDLDHDQRRTQSDQSTTRSTPLTTRQDESTQRAGQSDSQAVGNQRNMRDQSRKENRGFMASAPANGIQADDLIGAEVSTNGDEDVGPVDDLIIDENGQIVAIIVGVGGFLGMGEKSVAIGWDDVTLSNHSDEIELRIDVTREGLRSAPEYEEMED
ncbi:MAG: PRC-barrel domain-containing protein [Pseudohongiellaceae bacterium]